jgi:hypothetical protein
MARLKVSRGQPCASESGPVKKPKLERKPKLIIATTQPATMITEGR